MPDPTPFQTNQLTEANAAYRAAKERADEIVKPARSQLTTEVVNAYRAGVRKADILRAINHEWSRQWLDELLRDVVQGEAAVAPKARRARGKAGE